VKQKRDIHFSPTMSIACLHLIDHPFNELNLCGGIKEQPVKESFNPYLSGDVIPSNECDYYSPTPLYKAIEAKDFRFAIQILVGSAYNITPAFEQANTWIRRRHADGTIRWRILPLHAALFHSAPVEVIDALTELAPMSTKLRDDAGMLAIHIAFRGGCSDDITRKLLLKNPDCVTVRDNRGHLPHQCARSKENLLKLYCDMLAKAEQEISAAKIKAQKIHYMKIQEFFNEYITAPMEKEVVNNEEDIDRVKKKAKSSITAFLQKAVEEERNLSIDTVAGMKQALERRDKELIRIEAVKIGANEQLDKAKKEVYEYREQVKEFVNQQDKLVSSLRLEIEDKEKEFSLLITKSKAQIKVLEEKLYLNECGKEDMQKKDERVHESLITPQELEKDKKEGKSNVLIENNGLQEKSNTEENVNNDKLTADKNEEEKLDIVVEKESHISGSKPDWLMNFLCSACDRC